ncbi:MAG: glycosyltransferase [Psychroserpens sp.]|uniref:glycosyltransferase n=1 Tax=Psychroserpens sp. TaxID=2020870 RepID=UPI003002DE50
MLLSIRLMSYNHGEFIDEALEGVNNQNTNFKFEVVIGDDFSTDDTLRKIQAFQFTNPNLTVHILERKKGDDYDLMRQKTGRLYNFYDIINHCQGKYIALLDGDDYWTDPLKLQKQVDFLELNLEYTFSFTRFEVKDDNKLTLIDDKNGHYFNDEANIEFTFEKFAAGWYGGVPTLVFKAAVFDTNLILKYTYFRDIYLFTELLKSGKGVCLNVFSAVYRIHEGGVYSSATILERAQTGSLCYKELYEANKDILHLKLKYYNFHRYYIHELIKHKKYAKTIYQVLVFGFKMKDLGFMNKEFKKFVRVLLSKVRIKAKTSNGDVAFPGSQAYWEQRYSNDMNSGSGSYGRLAQFKAEVLNDFVLNNVVQTVIEFGCGDGNQLSLASYPSYKGLDVSLKAIEICKSRFKNDLTKDFYHLGNEFLKTAKADLVLSLDVLYHLVEDEVFENYMDQLFKSSNKYVIIYSSNYDEVLTDHVKCRKFTDWINKNVSKHWSLIDRLNNKYAFHEKDPENTSMSDFYIYKKV